ncbi:MAG: hypothetical protein LBS90_07425 [Oscillospiraceae bacterium]|jgi:predicted small lipoprotein YifL|nr:hypothetical protein [Oscillospiraceae bacterium]
MKKLIALTLALVMLASLAACGGGGLKGTYVPEDDAYGAPYSEMKFSGGKVKLSIGVAGIMTTSYTVSYTFKDDTLSFTIKELGSLGEVSLPCTVSGNTMELAGFDYVKK